MDNQQHYIVSQLYKPSFWREMLSYDAERKNTAFRTFNIVMKQYPTIRAKTVGSWLKKAYSQQVQEYPSAIIFKNALIKKYWLQNYSLKEAVLLDEFRIGSSITDALFLNGHAECIEIKSPLDTKNRLKGQINDYKQFSHFSSLLVHYTQVDFYKDFALYEGLGLLYLTECGEIERKNDAETSHTKQLKTMLQSLRKEEYLELTNKISGTIPTVGAFQLFKTCESWLNEFPIEQVQQEMIRILKKRFNHEQSILKRKKIPDYLYYPLTVLGSLVKDEETLKEILSKEI